MHTNVVLFFMTLNLNQQNVNEYKEFQVWKKCESFPCGNNDIYVKWRRASQRYPFHQNSCADLVLSIKCRTKMNNVWLCAIFSCFEIKVCVSKMLQHGVTFWVCTLVDCGADCGAIEWINYYLEPILSLSAPLGVLFSVLMLSLTRATETIECE